MLLYSQLIQLAAKLPRYLAAIISGAPYIAPEIQSGDVVDFVDAPVSAAYPIPTTSHTVFIGGVNKGSPPYTVVDANVTAGHLQVVQGVSNTQGSSSATSAVVNPIPLQRAWDQGLVGGNASATADYTKNQYLNNAGQSVRYPFYTYQNTTTNNMTNVDANGWPAQSFTVLITSTIGGIDGQVSAGTYKCSFRSVGQTTNLTGSSGCTFSGISNVNPNTSANDGVTTYFTLVVPFATNAFLNFDNPIQYLDIPRDGVTYTWGGPEFWSTSLNYFSQFSCIRMMDVCNVNNSTETVWSDRIAFKPEKGLTQPGNNPSWERIARLINAVTAYPGSRTTKVWINPPGRIDTTAAQSNNYAYQLPTLLNSILGSNPVQLYIEVGNEPWNGSFSLFGYELNAALTEAQALTSYGGLTNYISSVVSNGDGTATVTTSAPLSAIPLPDGSTFAITNSSRMVADYQQGNSTWGSGSITPNATNTADGVVSPSGGVAVTVTGSNTFTYPINGGVGVTVGTTMPAASGSSQFAMIFNLASNIVKDGNSLNVFQLGNKYHLRRVFLIQQIWSSVRPLDKFVMGLQQYTIQQSPVHYPYSQYLNGGSNSWAYGSSVAPYTKSNGLAFTSATNGNSFLLGVPFASSAVVGDQITITNIGTAGASVTTTVAAGSSGTTLNIATPVITSTTTGQITYVSGPSAAFNGYISGTTLTVTSGTSPAIGHIFNGTPATVAFGTKIISGSAPTWTVSISQTIGSSGAPVAMATANTDGVCSAMMASLPNFATSLAAHIYSSTKYGLVPMCYEGGPDTQSQPTQQVAIHTNPIMGTVVTTLLNSWFQQGGKEFNFYFVSPAVFTNGSQGGWPALQTFADTTSPKISGVLAMKTSTLTYQNTLGSPGTWQASGSSGAYVAPQIYINSAMNFSTTTGMYYSSSNSTHRFFDIQVAVPRTRRYKLQIVGSDSTASVLDIYIDDMTTSIGSITMPANGAGSSGSTVPGNATALFLDINPSTSKNYFTSGSHRIRIDAPIGRASQFGIFSIAITTY